DSSSEAWSSSWPGAAYSAASSAGQSSDLRRYRKVPYQARPASGSSSFHAQTRDSASFMPSAKGTAPGPATASHSDGSSIPAAGNSTAKPTSSTKRAASSRVARSVTFRTVHARSLTGSLAESGNVVATASPYAHGTRAARPGEDRARPVVRGSR